MIQGARLWTVLEGALGTDRGDSVDRSHPRGHSEKPPVGARSALRSGHALALRLPEASWLGGTTGVAAGRALTHRGETS